MDGERKGISREREGEERKRDARTQRPLPCLSFQLECPNSPFPHSQRLHRHLCEPLPQPECNAHVSAGQAWPSARSGCPDPQNSAVASTSPFPSMTGAPETVSI